MERRSLYATLKMLHADLIGIDARLAHGTLHVSIAGPDPTAPAWAKSFAATEMPRAADWLVDRAVSLYPNSALAKVRRLVAEAIAALPR